MIKSTNYFRVLRGICLILLLVSHCRCQDLSSSVVKIYRHQIYICAGTLVKDNFVVTLASCFEWRRDVSGLYVMGNTKTVEIAPNGESSVVKIFIHRRWHSHKNTGFMDVAVLKLEKIISGLGIQPTELCRETSIGYREPLTLYHWASDRMPAHIKDILELRTKNFHTTVKFRNTKFADTVFFVKYYQNDISLYDRGSPAELRGQFCAISNYYNADTDYALVPFTSLASAHVIKFIEESLQK